MIVANQDIEEGFHDTITGPGISGFVYYDTGSKTLTLKNASISGPAEIGGSDYYYFRALYVENSDITIQLIGENTISSFGGIVFRNSKCCFVGNGTLTINVPHLWGISLVYCDTLSIKDCSVIINSGYEGNSQWPGIDVYVSTGTQTYPYTSENHCHIFIDSASLAIHSPICMRNVVGFHLRGSYIVDPIGAYFDSDSMTVVSPDGDACEDLVILPETTSVPNVTHKEWTAWGNQSRIQIEGVAQGDCIGIYNMAGQLVHMRKADQYRVSLPVKSGVYIVKIGNCSMKVIVP